MITRSEILWKCRIFLKNKSIVIKQSEYLEKTIKAPGNISEEISEPLLKRM